MTESFVDLTYRGLALGRRIKLAQVRPTTGYLELPMPMPVGSPIAITTDDGLVVEATVTSIHEQVGGSDRVPGMTVKPALAAEAAQRWWQARVTLPEQSESDSERRPDRSRPITVRPRTHTVPTPPSPPVAQLTKEVTETKELSVYVAEQQPEPQKLEVTETKELSVFVPEPAPPPPEDDNGKRTMVMNAVDQELLAKLTSRDGEVEELVRRTGEHAIVDDGQRTTVMDSVDPSALGIEVSASGSFRAVGEGDGEGGDDAGDSKPGDAGTKPGKKRKKKR